MNKALNLEAMSIDEIWQLHEEIGRILSERLTSEKRELEIKLAKLHRKSRFSDPSEQPPKVRRKYPRVYPKYRNKDEPYQTWSGRGKQPRWLTAALKTGHTIDEFTIASPSDGSPHRRSV